jgi:tetratricopeptide (TPR) repeat protein
MAKKKPPARPVKEHAGGAWEIGAAASLVFATLIAYSPALDGTRLWDDASHITSPALQSVQGLWAIWSKLGATQQYYPLLHTAFWLEHHLWGDAVLGYHLTNVVQHLVSAFLVVLIVRRLSLPGAWLAGFLFALHPVCVESVAWISEQKNTLSAVFYLGSALAYLSFDRTRQWRRYYLALGLFVLALLSKTVTATLPAALLLVLWWQRGRIGWRKDVLPLVPWTALGVASGFLTAWVEREGIGAKGSAFTLSVLERCLLAGRVIWFYLWKLVWPADLVFIYPKWKVDSAVWWQWLFPLAALGLLAGLCWLARRRRGPLAGFLFFAGTLFPALGFFNVWPFVYSYVADHFQYLASLGVIVPFASVLAQAPKRVPAGILRRTPVLSVLLVTALGVLSWRQSGMYRDAETLYRETLARNPACWMAHTNLGIVLAPVPGRLPEAIAEFEAAARLKPDDADAHYNLGFALLSVPERSSEGVSHLEAAIRLKPRMALAHYALGVAFSDDPSRVPEAVRHLESAVQLNPGVAEAHYALGNALLQLPDRTSDAIAQYQAALRIRPDYAEAHLNLGSVLAETPGRVLDSVKEFEAALRIRPDYLGAHLNLGKVLSDIPGRRTEAIAHFEAALRIRPDMEEIRGMVNQLRAASR